MGGWNIGGSWNPLTIIRGHVRRSRRRTCMLCCAKSGVVSEGDDCGKRGINQSLPIPEIPGTLTMDVGVLIPGQLEGPCPALSPASKAASPECRRRYAGRSLIPTISLGECCLFCLRRGKVCEPLSGRTGRTWTAEVGSRGFSRLPFLWENVGYEQESCSLRAGHLEQHGFFKSHLALASAQLRQDFRLPLVGFVPHNFRCRTREDSMLGKDSCTDYHQETYFG